MSHYSLDQTYFYTRMFYSASAMLGELCTVFPVLGLHCLCLTGSQVHVHLSLPPLSGEGLVAPVSRSGCIGKCLRSEVNSQIFPQLGFVGVVTLFLYTSSGYGIYIHFIFVATTHYMGRSGMVDMKG